ncbi:thiamine diphosphokinase [Sulfitobacter sabulilitoris]|uniref:Thiamine diphosphokinase n=1 Tax=Sulfitobacter sabulilitoris TaxID=2562655 RepID=A0A5S3PB56_9RHOB|nr:thiamine diphosphokinase [Sulfitobacter sabulilitoris]TMM50828.1 thiamine diphosphokinase [Sulfitobacter sabulilitoris]
MNTSLIEHNTPVTLLGGGQASAADLREALRVAPVCMAADGGAALALEQGIDLAAVIGDFDSIAPEHLVQIPSDRQHRISEQNSTDFDKALRSIAAPVVLALGFAGGRIDHQLSALHTLVARADRPCVLMGATEIIFVCPPELLLPTDTGDVVSLFPMAAVQGWSDGLHWPIEGLAFDPARYVGTSNRAQGPVRLRMAGPEMLCILPRRLMPQMVQRLAQLPPPARWPARAAP